MNEPHYSDFKRAEAAQARVDAARAEVEDTVDGWTALPGHRAEPHVDFMHPALRDPDNEQNECCGGGCCTPASVEAEHFRHPSSQRFVERGEGCDYDEPAAIALMQGPDWGFRLDLGLGSEETTVWTCDISHEYVSINGHYRT